MIKCLSNDPPLDGYGYFPGAAQSGIYIWYDYLSVANRVFSLEL